MSHTEKFESNLCNHDTVVRPSNTEPSPDVPMVASPSQVNSRSSSGLAVLFTGLPGSGKTTLANELTRRLLAVGYGVTTLDGDDLRSKISSELGFSAADRGANLQRASLIASEVVKHKGIAVCSFVSPYERHRLEFRREVKKVGTFILVHVSTPLIECERRDPKGLYRLARAGSLQSFTGVSDTYELPEVCEIRIDTTNYDVNEAVDFLVQELAGRMSLRGLWSIYGKHVEKTQDGSPIPGMPLRVSVGIRRARGFQAILGALTKGLRSMTDISTTLGMGRHLIEETVRVVTGGTFRDLQQAVITERAKVLLFEGKPIKEVAYALGFSSPQTFHRFFLRASGTTPSAVQGLRTDDGSHFAEIIGV